MAKRNINFDNLKNQENKINKSKKSHLDPKAMYPPYNRDAKDKKINIEYKKQNLQRPQPHEVNFVISHQFCPDGFACIAVAHTFYKLHGLTPPAYAEISYGSQSFKRWSLRNRNVAIFDFSFHGEDLDFIVEQCNKLVIFDHHESASNRLSTFRNFHYNVDECGAVLAWKFYFPDRPVPEILQYVDDRDRWEWVLEHSQEINLAMWVELEKELDVWAKMLLDSDHFAMMKENYSLSGSYYMAYQNRMIERLSFSGKNMKFLGTNAVLIESNVLVSNLANTILDNQKDTQVVVIWRWNHFNSCFKYSLRSKNIPKQYRNMLIQYNDNNHTKDSLDAVEPESNPKLDMEEQEETTTTEMMIPEEETKIVLNGIHTSIYNTTNDEHVGSYVNVAKIAEYFGGGGHHSAASFTCGLADFHMYLLQTKFVELAHFIGYALQEVKRKIRLEEDYMNKIKNNNNNNNNA